MIELQSLYKSFAGPEGVIRAVEDVSLEIREGDVYGIVGYSGAGKSTLVRCINLLERPDAGTLRVKGFGTVRFETLSRASWCTMSWARPSGASICPRPSSA